jgi:hypothetical protein
MIRDFFQALEATDVRDLIVIAAFISFVAVAAAIISGA